MRLPVALLFVFLATMESPAIAQTAIRFSLVWAGANDLDLVVTTPGGYIISHKSPASPDGGILDVESNKDGDISTQPIEIIYFPEGQAPSGKYCVYVDYCKQHGDTEATPYTILVQTHEDGKTESKKLNRVSHLRDKLKFVVSVRNR